MKNLKITEKTLTHDNNNNAKVLNPTDQHYRDDYVNQKKENIGRSKGESTTHRYYHLINFTNIYMFNWWVATYFTQNTSISTSDNKNLQNKQTSTDQNIKP